MPQLVRREPGYPDGLGGFVEPVAAERAVAHHRTVAGADEYMVVECLHTDVLSQPVQILMVVTPFTPTT